MKLTKLSLAMAAVMGGGLASEAMALDLYVDTKTQQIYAEPGKGRVLLGEFQRVGEAGATGGSDAALKQEVEQIKQDLALKDNELKALDEHMKAAEETKLHVDKKGLHAESADGKYKFKLGGRIHADAAYSNNDDLLDSKDHHVESNDGTYIRRARMRFEGVFDKDWLFRTEADFADDSVAMKDIFIEYRGLKWGTLTFGQQKQNFSRELQESSNDLMFMERSLMDVLNTDTVDRAIGLNFQSAGKGLIADNDGWVAKLGIYGDSIKPSRTDSFSTKLDGNNVVLDKKSPESYADGSRNAGDEGWGISSRVIYNPILEKDKLIHLGIAGNYRTPDANGDVAESKALRYRYKTTANNNTNLTVLDTGDITDVDNFKMLGLEASGMYGPFYAGGEFTQTWISRKDGSDDVVFNGWYAEAAWSITGESRSYKEGNFGYLKPKKNFSLKNGGWGAWELATRWSEVNLNDGEVKPDGVPGGIMSQLTVALNWYINENVRFMADYNRNFNFTNPAVTNINGEDPDSLNTFMMRGQVAF